MADEYRVSQFAFEVLEATNGPVFVTAFAPEALHTGDPQVIVGAFAVEVLRHPGNIQRRQPIIGFSNKNEA